MNVRIEFSTENASFGESYDEYLAEFDRVLKQIALRVRRGGLGRDGDFPVFDSNGNTIGRIVLRKHHRATRTTEKA
jgi:hypothetical protein